MSLLSLDLYFTLRYTQQAVDDVYLCLSSPDVRWLRHPVHNHLLSLPECTHAWEFTRGIHTKQTSLTTIRIYSNGSKCFSFFAPCFPDSVLPIRSRKYAHLMHTSLHVKVCIEANLIVRSTWLDMFGKMQSVLHTRPAQWTCTHSRKTSTAMNGYYCR